MIPSATWILVFASNIHTSLETWENKILSLFHNPFWVRRVLHLKKPPFDGAIDGKVLKKVLKPQRNLITSIHYLHSEQLRGSPSVIRFICIVNTCPACLCLHIFYKLPFMAGKKCWLFLLNILIAKVQRMYWETNNLVYV